MASKALPWRVRRAAPSRGLGQRPNASTILALAWIVILLALSPVLAGPPADRVAGLRRGVNLTGWFRFPGSRDPALLRAWMSDGAMADLRAAGFTFVRLAADPAVLDTPDMRLLLVEQARRLRRHGLAVVVSAHPVGWRVDTSPEDAARLVAFWREMAVALRGTDPGGVFVEPMNEPVFHGAPAAWHDLQRRLLAAVRTALPAHTLVLTGHDWGGIGGLLELPPVSDSNVVYSFHFYDPAELTSLAAYSPDLDRTELARLPFPADDRAACGQTAARAADGPTRASMVFYCATGWDAPRVSARLLDAVLWARRHNAVLLAGEFGANLRLNAAARLAWLRLVRETCEQHGIGWALWGYDDVMGFGVPRPLANRPVLDRSTMAALGLASAKNANR